jgi:hypothetical protein
VPTVPCPAEPDVAVVPSAHDVAFVGGSIFVHAHVPIDVHTTINMDMGTSVYVRSAMMTASMMTAATVMASAMMPPSMASAVPFRVRRGHESKSERRCDRKNERKPLQHFCFLPAREITSSHCRNKFVNAH